jgi:hypothetical protein
MTSQGRYNPFAPLGRLIEVGAIGALTDRELLERFAAQTGEDAELAFSVLVGRHGGTVLRACLGVLGNKEDSLDAFQATVVILARPFSSLNTSHSTIQHLTKKLQGHSPHRAVAFGFQFSVL